MESRCIIGSKQISSGNNSNHYYYISVGRGLGDLPVLPLQFSVSRRRPRGEVSCPGHSLEDGEPRPPGRCPARRAAHRSSSLCLLFRASVGQEAIVCWAQARDPPGSG